MINGTSSKYDLKNWPLTLSRGYFRCWGHALVAFAVDERFKQESMYSLPAGTKKSASCGEVAVSKGSTILTRHAVNS